MPGGPKLSSWEGCWGPGTVVGCSYQGGFSLLPCPVPSATSSSGLCTLLNGFCGPLLHCSLPEACTTASPSLGDLQQAQTRQSVP